jgi:tetratricopeptide (TPR) repeat protein
MPHPRAALPLLLLLAGASAAPQDAARREFEARQADRLREAKERLEEVKRELDQERRESAAAEEARKRRLAGKTLTLDLATGERIEKAAVRSFTAHEAELDEKGTTRRIVWNNVKPESIPGAVAVLFEAGRAEELYEKGSFFVARRMWKEAHEAFQAAAAIGDGFASRVADFSDTLERLVSGRGGFRGAARRFGRNVVRLRWDFKEPAQLEDFTRGLVLRDGAALLEAGKEGAVWVWGGTSTDREEAPMAFSGEVSAELTITADGPVAFLLFGSAVEGWEIELGPAGTSLFRIDPSAPEKERRKHAAGSADLKLTPGKPMTLRLGARFPRFSLQAGDARFQADEPPRPPTRAAPAGPFGLRIGKGSLRIAAPLVVQGRVEAADLDRRLNDTEVVLRRALDPDLDEIERRRAERKARALLGERSDLHLSSDDPYFNFRIKTNEDLALYESMKAALGGGISADGDLTPEKWRKNVDGLLAKYPDVPSLWYLRALFRENRMDPRGAKEDLREALKLFPDFPEALTQAAEFPFQEGDLKTARAVVDLAIRAKPDFLNAYVLRGRIAFAGDPGDPKGYEEDFAVARKLDLQGGGARVYERMFRVQAQGPRALGCRFEAETEHYLVATDVGPEAARRYAENLEAAYRHYAETFHPPVRTRRKPRVAVFQSAENYYTYFELLSENRGESTLGVFRPELNELVLFETSSFGGDSLHTLYHEAVHQYMTLVTPTTPPFWYNEGLAEYLGAIEVKDGKVVAAALIQKERLGLIRSVVEAGSDFPFERIMNETPGEFYGPGVGIRYAQAWSMVHFLYEHGKGRHREKIRRYFHLLRDGWSPRQAYDDVFAASAAELQKEWRTFVKGLK